MEQKKIDRINALARKSRESGLTDEEKLEQQALRAEYIESYTRSLRNTLDNSSILRPDGTKEKVRRKTDTKPVS
ncbi:MAG: DUF896 domain-containing protein [Clostridiales bacterium]|nr:DUF896 domain-containing protein [Clostridiales bacterium]